MSSREFHIFSINFRVIKGHKIKNVEKLITSRLYRRFKFVFTIFIENPFFKKLFTVFGYLTSNVSVDPLINGKKNIKISTGNFKNTSW